MKKVAFVAFLFLIIGIVGSITFSRNVFSFGSMVNFDEEKEINGEKIMNIEASMDIGQLNVTEGEGDNIIVHATGNLSKHMKERINFDVETDGDTLLIRTDIKDHMFSFNLSSLFDFNHSLQLDITLPSKVYESLEFSSDIGKINIENVKTDELTVTSDVGKITLDQVRSQETDVSSNVGKVTINEGVGSFDVETDTGKVDLNLKSFSDDISIQSDVGEVRVNMEQQPSDFILDLKSDVGEVNVEDLENVANTTGKNYYVEVGEGGPVLSVQTDVGGISIEGK